jgi:ArsR family transcriptional regulator, arsenate/arsenite/antimonite-responsive transcriptional repressor
MHNSSTALRTDTTAVFKALADETRLRILHLLLQGELCVCEMVEVLGASQSKASRHLAVLRNAGLVEDRREGAWVYYSLSSPRSAAHEQVLQWLDRAGDEIPRAEQDLKTLAALRPREGLCGSSRDARRSPDEGRSQASRGCGPNRTPDAREGASQGTPER